MFTIAEVQLGDDEENQTDEPEGPTQDQNILDQSCSFWNHCPEGYECFKFEDLGKKCAKPDFCSYYGCSEDLICHVDGLIFGTPKVVCSTCADLSKSECENSDKCEWKSNGWILGECVQKPMPIEKQITAENPITIPSACFSGDYYCPWECNDCNLDNDCGKPAIHDFVEMRTPNQYLQSPIVHWDDTAWKDYQPLLDKVGELTNGVGGDYEKAKIIANWVKNSRPYGFPSPANEGKTVIEIFESDSGVCMDAAILTAAMLRVAGIPARAILPGFHEYVEAYIDGRWIGFDSTFGQGDALIVDPVSALVYDNEFYKMDPYFTSTFSDGTPRNLTNVSYYKVNQIPKTISKQAYAQVEIDWAADSQGEVKEKFCELSSSKTSKMQRFESSPFWLNISMHDNSYFLDCKVTYVFEPNVQYEDALVIFFNGKGITTKSIAASNHIQIDVKTIKVENIPAGWGSVYVPTSSLFIFKDLDGGYRLEYDKNNYSGVVNNPGWMMKSDNLDCDFHQCFYTESNGYSQHVSPPGILGYGTWDFYNGSGMPSNHHNGFFKIALPEGKYKIIYIMDTYVGYAYFEVFPNQNLVLRPGQLIKDANATQNQFSATIAALERSIEGLHPEESGEPPVCGNGICEKSYCVDDKCYPAENSGTCPNDCGKCPMVACPPPMQGCSYEGSSEQDENGCIIGCGKLVCGSTCGNGICENGEDAITCPSDCWASTPSYRYTSWICHDGSQTRQGSPSSCKPTQTWRAYADSFCSGKCSNATGKCGVTDFALEQLCNEGISCLYVCSELYELKDNSCKLNGCGSGCGPDYLTTFRTKQECENALRVNACIDSDGGANYYTKGTAYYNWQQQSQGMQDRCLIVPGYPKNASEEKSCEGPDCFLNEVICQEGNPIAHNYACPNGCREGACI